MSMEDWVQATLAVPEPAAEAASAALFDCGAGGVWEDVPDELGRVVLRAGFAQGQEMRLMSELPAALLAMSRELELDPSDLALSLEPRPGEDYAESWKRDLTPVEISKALVIAPSWWDGPLPGDPGAAILRLDPGSAFGSGHHPTTFMCLKILCELLETGAKPQTILDLGAGSGVLALSAALLLPKAAVTAIDNDPDTIFCAKSNLETNNLTGRFEPATAVLEDLDQEYDLILANLTRNAVLELARELGRKSKIPGRLIISGLLADQAPDVIKALGAFEFICERHLGQAEWSALSLVRGFPVKESQERVKLDATASEDLSMNSSNEFISSMIGGDRSGGHDESGHDSTDDTDENGHDSGDDDGGHVPGDDDDSEGDNNEGGKG